MSVDRKQNIVDAAARSFTLFGYKATTMDQVARIASVAKGTIYTFFKNKEELFNDIIDQLIFEMKLVAKNAIQPNQTFAENLHQALFKALEFRKKHQLALQLSQEVKEIGTPEAIEAIQKLEDAVLSFVKKQVHAAIEKGEIKRCDPEVTAYVMVKMYIALVIDWEKENEPLDKQKIGELFRLYLLEGLAMF